MRNADGESSVRQVYDRFLGYILSASEASVLVSDHRGARLYTGGEMQNLHRGKASAVSGSFIIHIGIAINIITDMKRKQVEMPAFSYVRLEDFMRSTDKKRDNKVLMSLRISIEEKEQIEEKARKTGLTTSEYIRRCALGRKLPCYGDTSLLKEYSMQLGKTGSNLNQIAKHLNSGGSYLSVYSDVKEAVNELLDLKFKILPALEDVVCGRKRRRKIEKDGEA